MIDQSFTAFVANQRESGRSDTDIRSDLSSMGYAQADIDAAFAGGVASAGSVAQASAYAGTLGTTISESAPRDAVEPLQVGKMRASWMLAKASYSILQKDPALLLFPLLEALFVSIFFIIFVVCIAGAYIFHAAAFNSVPAPAFFVLFFLLYFGGAFIIAFFRTAMISVINGLLHDVLDHRLNTAFGVAASHLGRLVHWALYVATVGIIVQLLEGQRNRGIFGILLYSAGVAIDAAWRIGTYFSLVSMLIADVGPDEAIVRSVSSLKRTWGEALSLYVGTGLVFFFLYLIVCLVIMAAAYTYVIYGLPIVVLYSVAGSSFISLIAITTLSSALDIIYRVVVYEYADLGDTAKGFSPELLALSMGASSIQ